mgnify:FL=1
MGTTKTYAYTARDGNGRKVSGRIDAASEGAVLSKLRVMGIAPVTVSEAEAGTGLNREINLPSIFSPRVGGKDLAVMSRQMATMIVSGLSLIKTLTILAEQTDNKKLAAALVEVRADVEAGGALSDSFAKHPIIFPRLMIYLVKAGEAGGFLDRALDSVAKNLESDVKLRGTIRSALTYPIAVLIMAVVGVFAMLIFIVPVFEGLFASFGGVLPLPTQVLVTLSKNMIWIVPTVIVLVVAFSIWWSRNKHTEQVRKFIDPLKLKAPVFGVLASKIAIARFSRNFAIMIGSGVPILQSLSIVGETSGNWVVENALRKVQESVRTGKSIAAPLAEEPVFPSMVVQMIAVGEDSGSLQTMLDKVADFYEEEVQSTAESLTALIEPLMIGVIGVVIGGMIVALYLPVFSIFEQIQ